jgi:hypothetical protein
MTTRSAFAVASIALASLTSLAACDTGTLTLGLGGSTNDAVLRIINTTNGAVDLTTNGLANGGSGHVVARTTSACIRIDPATTTIGMRASGATLDIPGFTPTLLAGGRYTAVAFTSDDTTTHALTLSDDFVPTSGFAALRVVHVAPTLGPLDVYVTAPGAPLAIPSTASVGFGGNTGYFDANPGGNQVRFTLATTPTLVLDAGTVALTSGQLTNLVLAQPGGPAGAAMTMLAPAC